MIEQETALPATAPAEEPRWAWPPLFGLLEVQFGAAVGYLQTAVPYWLAKDGMPLAEIGVLSGTAFSPHAWKLLWVPLIDLGPWRRVWYGVSTLLTALLLLACAMFPEPAKHLGVFTLMLTALQAAATTAHAALNGLMATTSKPSDKGRTGGWQMAGNVGSTAMMGALAIFLATQFSRQVAGIVLATLVLASGAGIFWITERHDPSAVPTGPLFKAAVDRVKSIVMDLVKTAFSRDGIIMLVLCLAPVSCGALSNLFSAMAGAYQVPEHTVEMVNGPGMAVTGAVGSLMGGWLSDRMNRKLAYALMGGATAMAAFAMAAGPMTTDTYIWGSLAYSFANGAGFAAFAGMVLEMVNDGAAVTTKYSLFVAASNFAISYTTALDGHASEFRGIGTRATIAADGLITLVGISIVALIFVLFLRKKPAAAPATA
ncbi:MFS transporter [Corallococcus sp. AB011P]|uniref:MFS transporter n=1 Tax=unclassified Corallococcus TaxID=2685029 RepID=UPI000EA38561|nr:MULTISPECIES: MFS transporter [unclassified Corallococcus]RKG57736.1 MFS transporter [Corallococcus sp. AB011P]RKH87572.1 MFS transporter [Corallococcus sp. AB045]